MITQMKVLNPYLLFLCMCVIVLGIHAMPTEKSNTTASAPKDGPSDEEKALRAFSISLGDSSEESLFGPVGAKNMVLRDGVVGESWEAVTNWSETQFHHGPYADRIVFDFHYGVFSESAIRKPVVIASNQGVASPQVIDFQMDEEEKSGSFTVVYDCQKSENADDKNTTILVEMSITSDISRKFGFRKRCGGGLNKYVDMGYYALGERGDEAETMGQRMMFPQPSLVVGPHVSSTRIFLLLNRPADTQEFFRVVVETGEKEKPDTGLEVSVQGPVFGGVLQRDRPTVLYILYDCKQDGKHTITLTVPLRPFNDLTARWEKDCGGGVAQGLDIGSEPGESNIVKHGVTNIRWLLGLSASSGRIGDEAPVVNTSTRVHDLWIKNSGNMALQIAPEVVTVEKPELLWIRNTRGREGAVLNAEGEDGGLLGVGGMLRLKLRMVCKKKGRSLVVVTLPIKSFRRVDFAFIKECRAPRQFHHSSFLRTADSTMVAVSLFLLCAVLMCWRLSPMQGSGGKNRAVNSEPPAIDMPGRYEFQESARRTGRMTVPGGANNRQIIRSQEKVDHKDTNA